VSSLIFFQLFAPGINYTGSKFTASINDISSTGGKILPPVSLIPVAKFAAGVIDTCGTPWFANIKVTPCYFKGLRGK
jgi:hypothetical protein